MSFQILIIFISFINYINLQNLSQCDKNIYENCNHRNEFSEQELEIARVWLQKRMLEADYKPRQSPCKKLLVSKDFKCLSAKERTEFIRVIRILYENGVMDRLTDIHQRYWAELHKSSQLASWHRWFVNVLQIEMQKISPGITVPYYAAQVDAAHPERSIVWQTLGRSGIHYTGYCVRDGMYTDLNTTRCIKRQWSESTGRIPPLDGLELSTSWLQSSNLLLSTFIQSGLHFNTHLAFGGYRGDMSVDTAPYDITFYLWHNYVANANVLKIQLQNRRNLTPRDINLVPKIDQATGKVSFTNLESDKLIYYENVSLLETFHVGFGELCTVSDQIIVAILQKIRNITVVPTAVRRLSRPLKALYFRKFLTYNFDAFDHLFEEVGDCNRECRPIPHFEPYVSTENGRRQLRRFAYDENLRLDWVFILSQAFHKTIIDRLNRWRYCSPYVTK